MYLFQFIAIFMKPTVGFNKNINLSIGMRHFLTSLTCLTFLTYFNIADSNFVLGNARQRLRVIQGIQKTEISD